MYNSHNLATMIKVQAKKRNIIIKDMLVSCDLGSNTMSALYHGKAIAFDSLAKIADYLECSVDYLLGRTDEPTGDTYLNTDEKKLIAAYRNKPEMQKSVNLLLGIEDDIYIPPLKETKKTARIAAFGGGTSTVEYSNDDDIDFEEIEKLAEKKEADQKQR